MWKVDICTLFITKHIFIKANICSDTYLICQTDLVTLNNIKSNMTINGIPFSLVDLGAI